MAWNFTQGFKIQTVDPNVSPHRNHLLSCAPAVPGEWANDWTTELQLTKAFSCQLFISSICSCWCRQQKLVADHTHNKKAWVIPPTPGFTFQRGDNEGPVSLVRLPPGLAWATIPPFGMELLGWQSLRETLPFRAHLLYHSTVFCSIDA